MSILGPRFILYILLFRIDISLQIGLISQLTCLLILDSFEMFSSDEPLRKRTCSMHGTSRFGSVRQKVANLDLVITELSWYGLFWKINGIGKDNPISVYFFSVAIRNFV